MTGAALKVYMHGVREALSHTSGTGECFLEEVALALHCEGWPVRGVMGLKYLQGAAGSPAAPGREVMVRDVAGAVPQRLRVLSGGVGTFCSLGAAPRGRRRGPRRIGTL